MKREILASVLLKSIINYYNKLRLDGKTHQEARDYIISQYPNTKYFITVVEGI